MSNQRTITLAADTPTSADDGYLLVVDRSGAGDCTITLDTDANQTWADGTRFGIAAFDGNVTITMAGSVTVDGSGGDITVAQGEEVLLYNVGGGDEWALNSGGGVLANLSDVTITGGAKGDLLAHNGTSWVDVTVGTNDHVLTADDAQAAGVKWAAASAAGFPEAQDDETTATYSLVAGDAGYLKSFTNAAGCTVTVPASVFSALDQVVLRADTANGVVVQAGSGMTFDPPGDIAIAEGQACHIIFTSASACDVLAPVPPVTSAEATAATETAVRLWSPFRVAEAAERGLTAFGGTHAVFSDAHGIPGTVFVGTGTQALTANTGYYSFWHTQTDITITEVGVELDTATGTETAIRVGVFAADADFQPNATGLIGQGVVTSPSSAGFKTITSLGWACPAGRYLTIVVSDQASTLRWHQAGSMGGDFVARDLQSSTPGIEWGTLASLGTSAFADPESDWTAVTTGTGGVKHFAAFNWS